MEQDTSSGRISRRWGLDFARLVAQEIGAKIGGTTNNRCIFKGRSAEIKSARGANGLFLLYESSLKHARVFIFAYKDEKGRCEVYAVEKRALNRMLRPYRGRRHVGAQTVKLDMVRRRASCIARFTSL